MVKKEKSFGTLTSSSPMGVVSKIKLMWRRFWQRSFNFTNKNLMTNVKDKNHQIKTF